MGAGAARSRGDRIGPYELVGPLGAGGTGEVWEAVLHGVGGFRKRVALKLLRSGPGDPASRDSLVREARLGAMLQHPNVVGTLQVGEQDGTWCIALELVRGVSVEALARSAGGRLPPGVVLDIGLQATAALQHVHTFRAEGVDGLVHRDVKPANLLVDRTGLVKLADLGISHRHGEAAEVAGTPGFMAPEQVVGRAEARSDLFALGAVLYAIATGRRPFGRGVEALAAVGRVEALLDRPGFLSPVEQVLPGLGSVVRSCLRHDPADRPASAREVMGALGMLRSRVLAGPTMLELLARLAPDLGVDLDATPVSDLPTRATPREVGNVPAAREVFVGRAAEVAEVQARVRTERWVVVVGPGGMGKTALATEVVRRARHDLLGGAWVFDLAPARSPEGICAAIAAALGIALDPRDPVAQLGRVFAAKGRTMVLLDNLEQLVEALPATLGRWLDIAPECHFLGTSRVVPGLLGERTVVLGQLPLDEAVRLFLARAPRAVTAEELPHVESLCRAVEGMPLAIELAAVRLRILTVPAVRSKLSLALLAGGGSERPQRHRSVAASLRWSWELLGSTARVALGQLSVFEGSFDPAAAEAVVDLQSVPGAPWALDVLQELVEASLVHVDPVAGRFRLGVVVREFAEGLLAPAVRAAAEVRHGAHFAQFGSPSAIDALDRGGVERRATLTRDLDDLVAACRRAVRRGDGETAAATARAAGVVFERQGPVASSLELASSVLAMDGLDDAHRATVEQVIGIALGLLGRSGAAVPHLERAAALHRDAGRRGAEGWAHATLASVRCEACEVEEAQLSSEAALAAARETGDRRLEGAALQSLGNVAFFAGRADEARAFYERALELHREVGNRRSEGNAVGNLAVLDLRYGRPEDARTRFEQALPILRAVGDWRSETTLLTNLGTFHLERGRMEQARELYERALALVREVGNRRGEGALLGSLGMMAADQGRCEEAWVLFDRALVVLREVGSRSGEGAVLAGMAELHRDLGQESLARARLDEALTAHREAGDRRAEAVTLYRMGHLHAEHGRWGDARASVEQSVALSRACGDRRGEGRALAFAGELRDDRASCERGLELLREAGDRRCEGAVLLALARFAVRDGRGAAAAELIDRGEQLLRRTSATWELAELLAFRAELRGRAGDEAAARALLDEAGAVAPWHAGAAREVARVRALLGA